MIKTAEPPAPPRTELEVIAADLPAEDQVVKLTDYLIRARAKTAEAMTLRDAAIKRLVAEGWSHRRVAVHAGVSVSTVRVVVR